MASRPTYTYDDRNRLVAAVAGASSVDWSYSGHSQWPYLRTYDNAAEGTNLIPPDCH